MFGVLFIIAVGIFYLVVIDPFIHVGMLKSLDAVNTPPSGPFIRGNYTILCDAVNLIGELIRLDTGLALPPVSPSFANQVCEGTFDLYDEASQLLTVVRQIAFGYVDAGFVGSEF